MTLAALLFADAAQAQLTLCNRTAQVIEVATVGEIDAVAPLTEGWLPIAPGACRQVAHNMAIDYGYYARHATGGRTWEGGPGGVKLCVGSKEKFVITYIDLDEELQNADNFRCPSGNEKRSFVRLPNPNGNNYRIDLK